MSCHWLKRFCFALAVALCFAFDVFAQSNAQPPAKPCGASPEYRQFDFWIGEWDVTANGNRAGESSVQLILGKCVVFENWTGARGMNGKSFNIYDPAKGKWRQTWVDDFGTLTEFTGEFKDGVMRFVADTVDARGNKTLRKMTFFPLPEGRVRQLGERSTDGGKTWSADYDLIYAKKKTATAESK